MNVSKEIPYAQLKRRYTIKGNGKDKINTTIIVVIVFLFINIYINNDI